MIPTQNNMLAEEFEDDDEMVTYTHDGEKHKIKRSTATQYAKDVSMGDDSEAKKSAVKRPVKQKTKLVLTQEEPEKL